MIDNIIYCLCIMLIYIIRVYKIYRYAYYFILFLLCMDTKFLCFKYNFIRGAHREGFRGSDPPNHEIILL